jgi:hypothetical protein
MLLSIAISGKGCRTPCDVLSGLPSRRKEEQAVDIFLYEEGIILRVSKCSASPEALTRPQ